MLERYFTGVRSEKEKEGSGQSEEGWSSVATEIAGTSYAYTSNTLLCASSEKFRVSGRGNGATYSTAYGATTEVSGTIPCAKAAPKPTGFTLTATGEQSITASWDSHTDLHGFKLERLFLGTEPGGSGQTEQSVWSEVKGAEDLSATSFEVTDQVACGSSYSFRLSARGDGWPYLTAFSTPTAEQSGSTSPCTRTAPAPTGLSASAAGKTGITASWSTQDDVAAYKLEHALAGTPTPAWTAIENIAPTPGANATTGYTVSTLECGTEYSLRVSGKGDGSPYTTTYGTPSAAVTGRPAPCDVPAPTGLSASASGQTGIAVTWSGVTAGVTYTLERSDDGGKTWPKGSPHVISGIIGTSQTVSGLSECTEYDFRVGGVGDGLRYSATPGPTAQTTGRTAPCAVPAPTGLSATVVSETAITVSWTAIGTGVKYTLQYDKGKETQTHSDITGTSYAVTGLTCGTAYTFKVNGVGSGWPYVATPGPTGQAQATTTGCDVPTPSLSFPQVTRTSITGQWSTYTDITYRLEYIVKAADSGAGGAAPNWSPIGNRIPGTGSAVSSVAENLKCGTAHQLRVEAIGDGTHYKNETVTTDPLTQSTSLCLASAPTNVQAIPTAQTSITVSWDTQSGVSTYKLERSDDSGANWPNANAVQVAPTPTGASHTYTNLTCGTDYRFRVSAIGDGINLDNSTYGSTSSVITASTDNYCTPQDLTIIPMPQRKAELRWGAVNGATYTVQIRKPSGNWPTPIPGGTVPNEHDRGTSTSHEIKLDEVFNAGTVAAPALEGLAHATAYHLRVQATVPGHGTFSSMPIVIIDTPILRANGNSPGLGANDAQVALKWTPIQDILGASYTGGAYTFNYRQLENDHTQIGWQPDTFGPTSTTSATINGTTHTITGLAREKIQAIQLVYAVTPTPGGANRVFAARDAYVWPSDRAGGGGERVATFPLNYPLSLLSNKTYVYRICAGTFSSDANKQAAWRTFVIHALNQWHLATDGLVTMTHSPGGCADFSDHITLVYDGVKDRLMKELEPDEDAKLRAQVRAHVGKIGSWLDIASQDRALNEISVIDLGADEYDALKAVKISAELARDLGFATCIFDAPACAPRNKVPLTLLTTDILLKREGGSAYQEDPPPLPTVEFNTCVAGENKAYEHLVHEAGHALGIREGNDGADQLVHHPTIPDSVMSYERLLPVEDPDCSPHPLDIMAIFALYQTR